MCLAPTWPVQEMRRNVEGGGERSGSMFSTENGEWHLYTNYSPVESETNTIFGTYVSSVWVNSFVARINYVSAQGRRRRFGECVGDMCVFTFKETIIV